MEELCTRCPHISEFIFRNLDNRSLVTCRLVNKQWMGFIDNTKIIWIRMISKYIATENGKLHENWKLIVKKVPLDVIKELAKVSSKHSFINNPLWFLSCDNMDTFRD